MYEEIFQVLNFGVIIISQIDFSIIEINNYAKEILLIENEKKITGDELFKLFSGDGTDADFFSITRTGGIENFFKKTDGSTFYGELTFTDLPDRDCYMITIRNAEMDRIIIDKLKQLETTIYNLSGVGEIIFESAKMKEVYNLCMLYHKEKKTNVLIEGETGTGKEIIASLIHFGNGDGGVSPFIPLNCAAIPENLFESELFGFVKGAFTGADTDRPGKIELSGSGSLFLDEIGELPLYMQPKLLRVLQEREYYRVGGNIQLKTDARFIAATNRDLEQSIRDGGFRADLYYRLNTGYIKVPPLRERPEDIQRLTRLFINKTIIERNRKPIRISNNAMDLLSSYNWPGNVRELKHVIEKIVLMSDKDIIEPEDIDFYDNKKMYLTPSDVLSGSAQLPAEGLDLELMNRLIVKEVLNKFNGNKGKTAEYLGLSRSALRSRL